MKNFVNEDTQSPSTKYDSRYFLDRLCTSIQVIDETSNLEHSSFIETPSLTYYVINKKKKKKKEKRGKKGITYMYTKVGDTCSDKWRTQRR